MPLDPSTLEQLQSTVRRFARERQESLRHLMGLGNRSRTLALPWELVVVNWSDHVRVAVLQALPGHLDRAVARLPPQNDRKHI